MFGFYRIATAVPRMRVADVRFNTEQIIALIRKGIQGCPQSLGRPETRSIR